MHSCETRKITEENEQTIGSAQKNAIFSSQLFYGLETEFREEYNCTRSKVSLFSS